MGIKSDSSARDSGAFQSPKRGVGAVIGLLGGTRLQGPLGIWVCVLFLFKGSPSLVDVKKTDACLGVPI